jgi:hypothetical protein
MFALLTLACVSGVRVDDGDGDGFETPDGGTFTVGTPYDTLPVKQTFQLTDDVYDGMPVKYYIPDEPRAALWAFHGSDGGFATVTQLEWIEFYNALVPLGFAIILTESLDRDRRQWDTSTTSPTENVDFPRLAGMRDFLVATTPLSEETPTFGMGFSNGGAFVSMFAGMAQQSGWDMRGFACHNAGGYSGGSVPGVYVDAENDLVAGGTDSAQRGADQCTSASGRECPVLHGTVVPLDPRRFARMQAYSLEQSQKGFDELRDAFGWIDDDGNLLLEDVGEQIDALMVQYIGDTSMPSPTLPPTQLRVVWATHRVSSQNLVPEVEYFLSLL